MKKFLSIILTLVMVLAMAAPGFAASITVENAVNKETYIAYKIFDVTKTSDETGFAYSIKADNPWKSIVENYQYNEKQIFTLTPAADDPSFFVVTFDWKEEDKEAIAADFAKKLAEANVSDPNSKTVIAEDGKAKFENLDAGYYFVTTSVGALCALDTTDSFVVQEKNSIPSLDKNADKTTAAIDDEVTYTITVTDGTGTDQDIFVYDYMEAGLTLVEGSIEVKVENTKVDSKNYELNKQSGTVTEGDQEKPYTFMIKLSADYVKTLDEGAQVVITYKAKLNSNAEISTEVNTNKAWLHYSQQITEPKEVDVAAFKFDIIKTDSSKKLLDGAKFELYDGSGDNKIDLVKVGDNYRVADAEEKKVEGFESAKIVAGKVTINGLDKKIYKLKEIEAPAGYNKLQQLVEVDLTNGNVITTMTGDTWQDKDGGIRVENKTGALLPSTGGIGTTIFYAAGIILMAGAVFFVIRRRKAN